MKYIQHDNTRTSLGNCEVPLSQFKQACLVSVATLANLRSDWLSALQNRYVSEEECAELMEIIDELMKEQSKAAKLADKALSAISSATGTKIISG